MLEVAGLTLRHTGVVHSLGVAIVFSDTFAGRSSAVFSRVTVAVVATRWTERTRSNDRRGYAAVRSTYTTRGTSRGIDTMLRQARK